MRRLLTACAVLSLAGCLSPEDSVLDVRDTDPPEVQSTDPIANGEIASDGSLEVTFSEFMDVRTLRPGIAVFSAGREELPLTITVPAPLEGEEDSERGDVPYAVTVNAASGAFTANSSYTLVLRTILTDYEGNALTEEVRIPFRTGL